MFSVVDLAGAACLGLCDGQLAVQDIEGTLWQGRVARLVHPAFSTVRWHGDCDRRPCCAGVSNISYSCKAVRAVAEPRAGRGLLAGVYVTDAHLTLPAAELAQRLQLDLVSLAGDFQIDLDELRLSDAGISALQGVMVWRGAQFIQPSALMLGHLQMQLGLREGQVVGTLSDQGGPLELTGELLIGRINAISSMPILNRVLTPMRLCARRSGCSVRPMRRSAIVCSTRATCRTQERP